LNHTRSKLNLNWNIATEQHSEFSCLLLLSRCKTITLLKKYYKRGLKDNCERVFGADLLVVSIWKNYSKKESCS